MPDVPELRTAVDELRRAAADATAHSKEGQFWPPKAEWYGAVELNLASIWDAIDRLVDALEQRIE